MSKLNGSLAGLATLVCAFTSTAAFAETERFEMASYTNWPGGKEIAAGDYAAAVTAASITNTFDVTGALAAATNLCVAYTVMHEFVAAAPACDEALTVAKRVEIAPPRTFATHEATVKALSNRGVLRALRGDSLGAAGDFAAAAKLDRTWNAPSHNLAYLQSSPVHRMALARSATE